ncbi:MAG TPA: ABC transporter permease [Cyclobacteriaceae bacterium]|nr:ABC transporter permease [Cyclobacteriaceae bacterium]
MLQHYFTLAIRSIQRNKVFSLINITGLTVGIIAFVLITQYVSYETGFDRDLADRDKIFRVIQQRVENGTVTNNSALSFFGIRQLLRENFPDVASTGFSKVPVDLGLTFTYNGEPVWHPGEMLQADTSFFSVFSNLLVEGDPIDALKNSQSVILSQKVAKSIFGEQPALSQTLGDLGDIDSRAEVFNVSGVFRDLPTDSHLHFDAIFPIDRSWDTVSNYWMYPSVITYIKVKSKDDGRDIESRLNTLLAQTANTFPNVKGIQVELQAVPDINLQPGIEGDLETRTDVVLPLMLSIVAVCILFIAWINYINLETARFVTQAKEVGIRRVVGSSKVDLAIQFIVRYFCLNVIALTLAAAGTWLLLPYFSYTTGIPLAQLDLSNYNTWLIALGLYVAGSLIAGIYPVLLLLKLNPAAIIKGNATTGRPGRIRTSLVVVQYVTSISLIAFVAIANQQIDFMKLTDKKLDVEQVLAVENSLAYTGMLADKFGPFENELKTNAAIKEVSSSSNIPGRAINFTIVNEIKRNKQDPFDPTRFKLLFIDYNYIPLYDLKLKAGRNYLASEAVNDNTGRIILNEAAIHALGFKDANDAVNQYIYFQLFPSMKPQIEIVGVIEDHHHQSIKQVVEPTIYFLNMAKFQQVYYSVKLNKGVNAQEAVEFIEATYKKQFPKYPFNYFFVDDLYQKQFDSEIHFARVFGLFSGIASFLACLGILGITLFETSTRLKEISIRKVLGASARGIVVLLSRNNIRVVFISLFIAVPLAYYAATQWLLTYPVRINLTAIPFIVAGLSITLLTFLASGLQTLRAAQSNPVDHLKNE